MVSSTALTSGNGAAGAAKQGKEEFELTPEEIEKFSTAFKDPQFRDLFREYMDEISDPANRARYEAELAELECERGHTIRWVRPTPQFALRTTRRASDPLPAVIRESASTVTIDSTTCYVNLASSDEIERPTSQVKKQGGKQGVAWQIPHSLTPPRPDYGEGDDAKKTCLIFDVVFHPLAFELKALEPTLISSALDSIKAKFGTTLDAKTATKLADDFKYKGVPVNTAIREPVAPAPAPTPAPAPAAAKGKGKGKSPATAAAAAKPTSAALEKLAFLADLESRAAVPPAPPVAEPDHVIVHRFDTDMQDFTNSTPSTASTPASIRPRALVVRIQLPRVTDVAEIDTSISDDATTLVVEVPKKYHKVIPLRYAVDEARASAKWVVDKKVLELVLPVVAPRVVEVVGASGATAEDHVD
ncbi:hypothetical protein H9P43_008638 [Blastocladiella emersonii ATCC 22665]|nr:hypothetical protein H9P43_008638 [Blastocladiella emersonii ATCC 22665]